MGRGREGKSGWAGESLRSEISLFVDLLVALDVVANSKVGPAFKTHTAFGVLAHLRNVFLDVLEG